jgi:hypothetical protein
MRIMEIKHVKLEERNKNKKIKFTIRALAEVTQPFFLNLENKITFSFFIKKLKKKKFTIDPIIFSYIN